MGNKLAARKDGAFYAISKGPDVCLTPMGSSKVPVAYTSTAFFDKSGKTVSSVRYNGKPSFSVESRVSETTGTEPGSSKGVKNSGHCGPASITSGSPEMGNGGYQSARQGDTVQLNKPNLK